MTFSKTLILVGAYNRTYSNEEAVAVDWLGGKDFKGSVRALLLDSGH